MKVVMEAADGEWGRRLPLLATNRAGAKGRRVVEGGEANRDLAGRAGEAVVEVEHGEQGPPRYGGGLGWAAGGGVKDRSRIPRSYVWGRFFPVKATSVDTVSRGCGETAGRKGRQPGSLRAGWLVDWLGRERRRTKLERPVGVRQWDG